MDSSQRRTSEIINKGENDLISIIIQETEIKTTMQYHYTVEKIESTKCW